MNTDTEPKTEVDEVWFWRGMIKLLWTAELTN